jgi:hypothetical protein
MGLSQVAKQRVELRVSSAADKMDNFQAVAVVELGFSPAGAGDDVAIQLHGDAIWLHAESLDQSGQREGSRRAAEIALFPIDVKFHLNMRFIGRFFDSSLPAVLPKANPVCARSLAPPEKRLRSG